MEKETIWVWVILVAGLFLACCGGSPSSLVRDSSAILPGQVIGLPSAASGDADALLALADWKAFVSKNLQVEISHPPDWSVRERPKGVAFTSPDGRLIQLTLVGSAMSDPVPMSGVPQLAITTPSGVTSIRAVEGFRVPL